MVLIRPRMRPLFLFFRSRAVKTVSLFSALYEDWDSLNRLALFAILNNQAGCIISDHDFYVSIDVQSTHPSQSAITIGTCIDTHSNSWNWGYKWCLWSFLHCAIYFSASSFLFLFLVFSTDSVNWHWCWINHRNKFWSRFTCSWDRVSIIHSVKRLELFPLAFISISRGCTIPAC